MTPREYLVAFVAELGRDMLLPATEHEPDSVWVEDDRAPGGVAGYYVKRRVAPHHRITTDGAVFAFDFEHEGVSYRVRCGRRGTAEENGDRVVEVVKTLQSWIADGILTWVEAFAPFARSDNAWWRVLRVPPDATREEIDAAYRRGALKVHPDHGGSADAFRELRAAYERALQSRVAA